MNVDFAMEMLAGARVFVTTRERIKHPEGTDLFDEAIRVLREHLADRHGAGDADRSAELTTAWMAGVERERERAAEDAEDAAAVFAAMNEGYTVRKGLPSPYLTDEANASFAWIVERALPPHCDKNGVSMWHASTPREAIAEARAAIDAARAGERG